MGFHFLSAKCDRFLYSQPGAGCCKPWSQIGSASGAIFGAVFGLNFGPIFGLNLGPILVALLDPKVGEKLVNFCIQKWTENS